MGGREDATRGRPNLRRSCLFRWTADSRVSGPFSPGHSCPVPTRARAPRVLQATPRTHKPFPWAGIAREMDESVVAHFRRRSSD